MSVARGGRQPDEQHVDRPRPFEGARHGRQSGERDLSTIGERAFDQAGDAPAPHAAWRLERDRVADTDVAILGSLLRQVERIASEHRQPPHLPLLARRQQPFKLRRRTDEQKRLGPAIHESRVGQDDRCDVCPANGAPDPLCDRRVHPRRRSRDGRPVGMIERADLHVANRIQDRPADHEHGRREGEPAHAGGERGRDAHAAAAQRAQQRERHDPHARRLVARPPAHRRPSPFQLR
ncbi:MAG TPA: hypothetical protein VFF79_10845 [Conexibacter sp.]|nr:hypothetical protein [Conexibacter sp.]